MITITTKKLTLLAGAILLVAVGLILPLDAFAQAGSGIGTTSTITQNTSAIAGQIASIPRLIALACYILGVVFTARALFALKGFIEAPDDNPLTKVLGFAIVAMLLILLPYVMGVLSSSIGATNVAVAGSQTSFDSTSGF